MSRFTLALSLLASLTTTTALADRVSPPSFGEAPVAPMRFAQAPAEQPAPVPVAVPVPVPVPAPAPAPAPASTAHAPADMPIVAAVRLDRAAIRAKLAQNRAANLARFRVYQKAAVFPSNTFADNKLNVWLDANGHFCAAATIIKLSGNDDLAQRTAEQNNFIRLADVTQGPLMDWILTSGLTQDEIAAIQEPFMPVVRQPSVEPQPLPQPIVAVDGRMRRAEDRRLVAKYKSVDAQLVKNKRMSLDAATDRLLANPDLASQFLAN